MRRVFARTKTTALIRDNTVPQIATVTQYGQNFNLTGGTSLITKLTFDFDSNGVQDDFFFESNKLKYYSINILRRKFMREFYRILLEEEELTLPVFISAVQEYFVFHELGFYSM